MQKILLVDDDNEILSILKDFLEEHKYIVRTNSNGDGVIEQIIQFEPEIILLDVVLGKNSGFDILRDIRNNPLTCFMPVLMLTGEKDENSQIEGLTSGADDYIIKPFDLNVLHARILAVFRRSLMRTRSKYDQMNLINYMMNMYLGRRYTVFSKFSNRVEEHPNDWKGFVPDLIIMKKNKVRCFIFETAQSILEEQFLKRAEQLSHVSYKDFKIEPNLVIRSKETYRQCAEILKEYEFNIKIKLMKKSTKPKKVLRE